MKIIITIILLTVSISANDSIPEYKRKYFKHWTDSDKNCQQTRAEVLIRDAIDDKVMYKTDKKCKVIFAAIHDHYSGKTIPSHLADIEHVVPLKQAWISGAWKWTPKRREEFANYMEDEWHLLAVHLSLNRSKSFRAPHEWMPPDSTFHVFYCLTWIRIKVKWELTATEEEIAFIKTVLRKYDKKKKLIYPKIRR